MSAVKEQVGGTILEKEQTAAMRQMMALAAPITLAQMDPHSLSDLSAYLKCLADAVQAGDPAQVEYIQDAIREVFELPDTTEGPEVGEILDQITRTEEGAAAVAEVRGENEEFMGRYVKAKTDSGLHTQKQVAARCGVAVNTVNAIETERTIPQFRTVRKLAEGFGVRPEWLLTGQRAE